MAGINQRIAQEDAIQPIQNPGVGGGSSSTSTSSGGNSQSSAQQAAARAIASRLGTTLRSVQVIIPANMENIPIPVPAIFVPDGYLVRVRAVNALATGNVQVIYVAEYREAFQSGHATPLAPFDDQQYQVNNTGKLWICGHIADGVVITVVRAISGQ